MRDAKVTVEVSGVDISDAQNQQLNERFRDVVADVLTAPVVNVQVAFKIGDIVRLNSGGPAMTVTEIKNDYLSAQWFTQTAEPSVRSDTFYHGTVCKVK